MEIELFDETEKVNEEDKGLVFSVLKFAAEYLNLPSNSEVSVTFVSNCRIREINRDYRKKDAVTDVISFAIQEGDDFPFDLFELEEEIPKDFGDLFISADKAEEQAKEYGHSFQRELGFLALHGFLHLNGYDHMNEEDEKEMFGLQNTILKEYGLERPS